jgi:hypothetical protein
MRAVRIRTNLSGNFIAHLLKVTAHQVAGIIPPGEPIGNGCFPLRARRFREEGVKIKP